MLQIEQSRPILATNRSLINNKSAIAYHNNHHQNRLKNSDKTNEKTQQLANLTTNNINNELNEDDVEFLIANTGFSLEQIKNWHSEFIEKCTNGLIAYEQFKVRG